MRKYYKIINENGHNGLLYKEGLNVDPLEFNPFGDCEPGGIYFSDAKNILHFRGYGQYIAQCRPVGEVYENPGNPKKWKAHEVKLGLFHDLRKVEAWQWIIDNKINVHAGDDSALRWASDKGLLDVVKFLMANGANVHAGDDCALRWASEEGHLDVVKFLMANGANIHADDDCALRWASEDVRVYLESVIAKEDL